MRQEEPRGGTGEGSVKGIGGTRKTQCYGKRARGGGGKEWAAYLEWVGVAGGGGKSEDRPRRGGEKKVKGGVALRVH